LGAKVTGGAARKGLQEEGLLNEREGKFLQAFMEWAGEHGSPRWDVLGGSDK
jgi:hypothetical protein